MESNVGQRLFQPILTKALTTSQLAGNRTGQRKPECFIVLGEMVWFMALDYLKHVGAGEGACVGL